MIWIVTVPNITGHYHIGETEFSDFVRRFEKQRLFLFQFAGFSGQKADVDRHRSQSGNRAELGRVFALDHQAVNVVEVLVVSLV